MFRFATLLVIIRGNSFVLYRVKGYVWLNITKEEFAKDYPHLDVRFFPYFIFEDSDIDSFFSRPGLSVLRRVRLSKKVCRPLLDVNSDSWLYLYSCSNEPRDLNYEGVAVLRQLVLNACYFPHTSHSHWP